MPFKNLSVKNNFQIIQFKMRIFIFTREEDENIKIDKEMSAIDFA